MRNLQFIILFVVVMQVPLHAQTPPSAKDYFDSGAARLQKGDLVEAINDLSKAIELNPRFVAARHARGMALFLKGDFDAALADYDKVIELAPSAPGVEQVYNNRSVIRVLKGDKDSALSDLNTAILRNPRYAEAYNGRGNIRASRDDLEGAGADYEKAVELKPTLIPAISGRGMIRFRKGDLSGALSDYNKVIELAPDDPYNHVERGLVRGLTGDMDRAVEDMKKGFSLNPKSVTDKELGHFTSPFKNLNHFMASNPGNARAYVLRGLLRTLQGNGSEAERDFRKSLELDPQLRHVVEKSIKAIK